MSSLTSTQALRPETVKPTAQNVGQWALLGWFSGAITVFALEQRNPASQFTHIANNDFVPGIMGGAVVLLGINAFFAVRARKKELADINATLTNKDQKSNFALWAQAARDQGMMVAIPVIASIAVLMNLAERIAPMMGSLASTVLRSIGGSLFALVEGLVVFQHIQAARAHSKSIATLEKWLQTERLKINTSSKFQNAEDTLKTLGAASAEHKALSAAFAKMKSTGFDMSQSLTRAQWIEKALITHRFYRTSNRVKAVMHGLIGAGMAVSFAIFPPLALGAFALRTALWVSLGTLGARLLASLTPERKWLKAKLEKSPVATVFEKTPASATNDESADLVVQANPLNTNS